ncbi:MAG TPA: hypothetical protein VF529_09970 [Solirubrobacteraceae bacterium]
MTKQGRLLRDFEGLLRKTFGRRDVSVSRDGDEFNCAGDCAPLAEFAPYASTYSFTLDCIAPLD